MASAHKGIIAITVLIAVMMTFRPPWVSKWQTTTYDGDHVVTRVKRMGYGSVFSPPNEGRNLSIDFERLGTQFFALTLLAGTAIFLTKKNKGGE